MAKVSEKVVTGKVRFSYVNVFKAVAMEEGMTPKFSVSIIIDKKDKDTIDRVNAAFEKAKAASATLFGGTVPKGLKGGLRDGDGDQVGVIEQAGDIGGRQIGSQYFADCGLTVCGGF